MNDSPASNPTAGSAASNETAPNTMSPSASLPTGGVSFAQTHIELGAALLECANMGEAIDKEIKQRIHVPSQKERLTSGMTILANMQAGVFAMLADANQYNRTAFYDACEAHRKGERAAAERRELARMAGMSVEEFDKKFNAISEQNKHHES